MGWRNLSLRLRALFDRKSLDRDLEDELAYHLERETQANIENGLNADEAARRARLDFGAAQSVREEFRDVRGDSFVESLIQDARFGWRTLRHNPGFTLVAVLTLALGIGANTAMFSVINAVLLRPLPYDDPDRLVRIIDSAPSKGFPRFANSPANFLDWREQARSFSGMAAVTWGTKALSGQGDATLLQSLLVTPDFFTVFGVHTVAGRAFVAEEGTEGHSKVAILSYRIWQKVFGGRADVIGRNITLDGDSFEVVGVAPPQFRLYNADLFTPLVFPPDVGKSRGAHFLAVYARLKQGVSQAQAQQEMKTIAARLEAAYPNTNKGWTVFLVAMQELVVGQARRGLLILFGAVAILALIACANVSNLLLARAVGRRRELSVRAALGASRGRIIRQLLAESLLLCMLGAAAGLAVAYVSVEVLKKSGSSDIPRLSTIHIDPTVLAFTAAFTLLSTFLFGMLPAWRASRVDLNVALTSGTRAGGAREWSYARNLLVLGELAVSVMLLVGAALLIRSFTRLVFTSPGIDPEHVLTFNLTLPKTKYATPAQVNAFYDELFRRLRALPGVTAAEGTHVLPVSGGQYSSSFSIRGVQMAESDHPSAEIRVVTPGFFQSLHIPILRGRGFTDADNIANGPIHLVISATMAQRFWPRGDAIGHVVTMGVQPGTSPRTIEGEIVGVVGDVRDFGLDTEPLPTVYAAAAVSASRTMSAVIRVSGDPEALASAARAVVAGMDPNLPLGDLESMENVMSTSLSQRRFYMLLLSLFAAVALALVCTGIYGVVSYAVTQRTREIGIRMALGARRTQVLAQLAARGVRLVAIGLIAGLAGAFALRNVMAKMLVGISTADMLAFAGASGLVLFVGLVASVLPARRATSIEPVSALRYD